MSSFRDRAVKYDINRRNRRGATTSQFGKVGRNIDAESEKPKLVQERFVERAKVEQDEQPSTSKSVREEMDTLEEDKEKEVDSKEFEKREAPPTVRKAPAVTNDELVTRHQAGGAFIKAWTIVDHVVIPPVIQPRKSSFIPNFIAANVIIQAMEVCLDGNEELKWISPNFFFLPVRLYYSVMFYIQILKAKEAAGKLGKTESTWFRAFKRNFPLESLPVVGPLIPYFSNVVAVKPNDDKYDFIYPDYDTRGGLSVTKGVPAVDTPFFLQPNVLFLAELLRQFCTLRLADLLGTLEDGSYRYFNDNMSLIPHRLGHQFRFAGIEYGAQPTVATASTLSNPALDGDLPETKDRSIEIHPYWRRSKCIDIPAADTTTSYSTIGEAMRMTEDFEWFEECIHMATIECKFFSDSTNMSQIPSTGGSEALVSAHITGADENYRAPNDWYPRHWRRLKSTFQTTRADTGPDQFLNAGYALSTGTISWTANGHPIGGRQVGHRVGPYWNNREFEYRLETPVEVARRVATMVRSQFYDSRGEAS